MTGTNTSRVRTELGAWGLPGNSEVGSYSQRLGTFEKWAGPKNKEELARSGFTYTGTGDKVICQLCGLEICNWSSSDDAGKEHATRRPTCPFVISQSPPVKHPKYKSLQARLESFADWPRRYVPKSPEELAEAGFFYIGSADRVTCFQCGTTLRDWEAEHDPVVEHQRYSKSCPFINNADLGLKQLGVEPRTSNGREPSSASDEEGQCATGNDIATLTGIAQAEGCSSVAAFSTTSPPPRASSAAASTTSTVQSGLKGTARSEETSDLPDTRSQLQDVDRDSRQKSDEVCKHGDDSHTGSSHHGTANSATSGDRSTSPISTNASMSTSETTPTDSKMAEHQTLQSSRRVAEENKRMRARRTCKVCQTENVSILFLPCGHLVTCSNCAPKVKECVVCGKVIVATVKTYST